MSVQEKVANKRRLFLYILNISFTLILVISAIGLYLSAKASIENEGGRLVFISEPRQTDLTKQYVQIIGEIEKPGIYEIKEGMRVFEIIDIAGGIKEDTEVDLANINLVREIKDGEIIIISEKNQVSEPSTVTITEQSQRKVNINTADIQELTLLPGIGIATAEKIVSTRPFNSIEDIMRVSGIGQAKYSQIIDLIEI